MNATQLKPSLPYSNYDWNTPEADEYWNQVGGCEPSEGWRSIKESGEPAQWRTVKAEKGKLTQIDGHQNKRGENFESSSVLSWTGCGFRMTELDGDQIADVSLYADLYMRARDRIYSFKDILESGFTVAQIKTAICRN